MSRAYYNENDPFAAQWLRNLIAGGHIADGDVDDRSILDVRPKDLLGYTQCHFFAGIGGWSYALRLAGWPDDRPVWTGSAPCQPFSLAGQQRRFADERHLWPAFFHLIEKRRPPVVFGEQVAGKPGLEWLDLVFTDLEGIRYTVGAADIPASGVGAPHRRQRLYWVANADFKPGQQPDYKGSSIAGTGTEARTNWRTGDSRTLRGVAHAYHAGLEGRSNHVGKHAGKFASRAASPWDVGDATAEGLQGESFGRIQRIQSSTGCTSNPWDDLEWLACSDGKARPTQPGLFPLAHGIPARVGRLRAYGNAIVPQVAATFIRSYTECIT